MSSLVPYNDEIGKLGEALFEARIIRFCRKRPWFNPSHLGEKFPTSDYHVRLVLPNAPEAFFFAQVKGTPKGYTSKVRTRLRVEISAQDVRRLKDSRAPCYIIGVDVDHEQCFIQAITSNSPPHLPRSRRRTRSTASRSSPYGRRSMPTGKLGRCSPTRPC